MEEVEGRLDLDMSRQEQDANVREAGADIAGRVQPLGCMARRHPNIDDAKIRSTLAHCSQQRCRVIDLPDDVEAFSSQQAGDAFAQKDVVVRDYDACGWHWRAAYVPPAAKIGLVVDNGAMSKRGSRVAAVDNPKAAELHRPTARGLLSAYLDAALDCVVIADASGRVVEFNPAAERTFGYSRQEALGRRLSELIVPPSLREAHEQAFAQFAATGLGRLLGRRIELTGMRADGSEFPVELTLSQVKGEPLLVCGAVRDLSDVKKAEDDLRRLVDEHDALRRVATLVAEGAEPEEIFAAVAEESARILNIKQASVLSFEPDGSSQLLGTAAPQEPFAVGDRYPPHPGVVAEVWRTGRPSLVEYASVRGEIASRLRAAGMLSALGVPITVHGSTWGLAIALSTHGHPLPAA